MSNGNGETAHVSRLATAADVAAAIASKRLPRETRLQAKLEEAIELAEGYEESARKARIRADKITAELVSLSLGKAKAAEDEAVRAATAKAAAEAEAKARAEIAAAKGKQTPAPART